MLKTRVITAVVIVAALLAAVFYTSNKVWAVITLLIALIAATEWSNLIQLNKTQQGFFVMILGCLGAFILLFPDSTYARYQNQLIMVFLAIASLFWLLIAPIWLLTRKPFKNRVFMAFLGLCLIMATWLALVGLRSASPWLLLGVIATVSLADSAAYFAGKRFGQHKLAPQISPGKTWEGVLGALLAASLFGGLLCYFKGYSLWLIVVIWLAVILSIMGDLCESLLKRQAGLKDSGHLLPGHGGVLDRIDGLMPTLPIALFCLYSPLLLGFGPGG